MEAIEVLTRNCETLVSAAELKARLEKSKASGKPLRVKLGADPTRPDLHFGHMVCLNVLRRFQDLGHTAVLIIGDFTTMIGDPSGRTSARPVLTKEEIEENAKSYAEQAFKVLIREQTEIRLNSEWFNKMSFEEAVLLSRNMTVARMLERDDFARRMASNSPISITEFLYRLVQGHDSVMIEADLELGLTDQTFNLLVGRHLQKTAGQPEQIVITFPLLVGLDGEKKMSKSQDNYIAFNDPPKEMFGKIMSVRDEGMWEYYRLLLDRLPAEIEQMKQEHPMAMKKQLAVSLTNKFHGEGTGEAELSQFEKVFSKQELPDEMPEFTWEDLMGEAESGRITEVMALTGLFPSKKECRRMIEQGAVKIDGEKLIDVNMTVAKPLKEHVFQAGKRKFFKLKAKN